MKSTPARLGLLILAAPVIDSALFRGPPDGEEDDDRLDFMDRQ